MCTVHVSPVLRSWLDQPSPMQIYELFALGKVDLANYVNWADIIWYVILHSVAKNILILFFWIWSSEVNDQLSELSSPSWAIYTPKDNWKKITTEIISKIFYVFFCKLSKFSTCTCTLEQLLPEEFSYETIIYGIIYI